MNNNNTSINKEKNIEESFDSNILQRLFAYAKPHFSAFFICIIMIAAITSIDLIIPLFTKIAIDEYIAPTQSIYYAFEDGFEGGQEIDSLQGYTLVSEISVNKNYADTRLDEITNKSYNSDLYTLASHIKYKLVSDDEGYYLIEADSQSNNTLSITKDEYAYLKESNKSGLINLSIAMMILVAISFVLNFLQVYILNMTSQKIVFTMREELFDHLQNMNLAFFDRNPVGRLVTRVTNDMQNINEMFVNVLVTSLKDIFLLGGTIIVMFSLDVKLALTALCTVPFIIVAAFIFRVKARDIQRDVKVKLAKINSTLAENLNGMKIIQIFNQEKRMYEEFDEINSDYLKTSVKETQIYAIFRPSMNLAYSVSLAAILWYGGGQAIQEVIELGVLVAFINYTQQFFRPIFDLTEKFNIFQSSMASSERIFMLMDETNPLTDPESPRSFEDDFKGEINFENVVFSYTGDEDVLKGVSFDVKQGETVALVGSTGSGKTTIISLLNRFYDIQSGSIKIDGIDIKDLEKSKLREKIGIVLQDVFLFAGDIKSNIRLNNMDISDEKIEDLAKYVNAHNFIDKLPNRYDEEVVERGATLSSGQRQLLSFARALAFDPKILILDEATSNIDTETELLIQDAITKLIKGRTTIIVAHRLSTIQHADKIIVMNKGEIRESGSHDELLSKKGIYYDLYQLQYQE